VNPTGGGARRRWPDTDIQWKTHMTPPAAEPTPARTDSINTRRMIRVVIALTLAMAVGLGLCLIMPASSPLPEVYRVLHPRGMAPAIGWRSIIVCDSGYADGSHDPQNCHFVIGNGRGPSLADGQMVSTDLWRLQKPWSPPAEVAGRLGVELTEPIIIVIVGNSRLDKPTDAQLAALTKLVYELSSRYRAIPLTHVLAYWEVTNDPQGGAAFPMSEFFRRLGEDHRRK
jgi:hypothetical protein